jgi:hypothetical protein
VVVLAAAAQPAGPSAPAMAIADPAAKVSAAVAVVK